jgi:hypothetical protein
VWVDDFLPASFYISVSVYELAFEG